MSCTTLGLGDEQSINRFFSMPDSHLYLIVHHFYWSKFGKHLLNICSVLKVGRCLRKRRHSFRSLGFSI